MDALLDVQGLTVSFFTDEGVVQALNDVNFSVRAGEIVGLAGESGSGKSVTALSLLRLISPPGRIISGKILFEGKDILLFPESGMRQLRGNRIAMVFQEPMTSLNPVMKVGNQVAETLILHRGMSRKEASRECVRLFQSVCIASPESRIHEYPHQLSGGMRQRVMIAMAIACRPSFLIADEPTTALDVTIQAEVLDLLLSLRKDYGISILLITHALSVLMHVADRVLIMYAGRIVEQSVANAIFSAPAHPYTAGLLRSIPRISLPGNRKDRLDTIEGTVPSLMNLPLGCAFYDRCGERMDICRTEFPSVRRMDHQHSVACYLHDETAGSH